MRPEDYLSENRSYIHEYPHKRRTFDKCFSAFLSVLPIFAIYDSGIPGFNIADIILFAFLGLSFAFGAKRRYKIDKRVILICAYCVYICTIPLLVGVAEQFTPLSDVLIRSIRLIFYIVVSVYLSGKHLETQTVRKGFIYVSLAAVLYIVLQYGMYYIFGRYLAGYVSFLDVYSPGYQDADYLSRFESQFFRPTSFFLEPAHCARYMIIGLVFSLFKRKLTKKYYLYAFIIIVGIILTTSGQGLAMIMIVVFLFLFWNPYRRMKPKTIVTNIAFVFVGLIVVLALFVSTDIIQNTLSRVSNASSLGAVSARLGTLFEILNEKILYLLVGHGYGAVPYEKAWMSGITYVIFGSGIVGLFILLCFFVMSIFSRKTANRVIAVVFFFLFITDDAFNSYMMVPYLSIILYFMEDIREKRIVSRYRD